MDPITHRITGALIGKGFFSKRRARVAIFTATLGAVFPDVDLVANAFSHDPLALARFPIMRFIRRGGANIVEFADPRFFARVSQETVPFSFEVTFDQLGNVATYGWIPRGLRLPHWNIASDPAGTSP